jgi:hypothetical protein
MRIAYVCTAQGIPVFGRKGCSIHVQEVVRAMVREGAAIDLFSPRPEGSTPADLRSVRVHSLPLATQSHPAARERAAFEANDSLRLALERHGRFDLVYERYALWSHAAMDYAQSRRTPGLLEVNAPSSTSRRTIASWSIAPWRNGWRIAPSATPRP